MKRLLYALLISSMFFGCGQPPTGAQKDEHGHEEAGQEEAGHEEGGDHVTLTPEGLKLAGVKIMTVSARDIQESITVPGTVSSTAKGRAVVTPPIAGRLISIGVQLGDSVQRGQVLATLESPELAQAWSSIAEARKLRESASAEVKVLKAEVDLSAAKLNASKANLVRQRDLVKAGAFSQAPVQQAQNELNEAQSELLSVQKEQASHAEQLRRLENLYKDGIVSKSELEAARLELQQDQIRLDRTKAKIENAKATYDRERNIASRGLLNAKELQTAEAEVRSSQLELDRARLRVRSAEAALTSANKSIVNAEAVYSSNAGSGGGSVGRVNLVAPISGTITHLDVTRGQAVDRTQVLMEVENLESVWVTANVPEQSSTKVCKGSIVAVTVASLPGQEFEGVVVVVGSRVDPKTRSIPAQCLITGSAGRLKPDMFAKVQLSVGSTSSGLVIPKTSLLTEGQKSFVFIQQKEEFEKVEVDPGQQSGDNVAILSGLKPGDMVVYQGVFVLASELKKSELKGHDH